MATNLVLVDTEPSDLSIGVHISCMEINKMLSLLLETKRKENKYISSKMEIIYIVLAIYDDEYPANMPYENTRQKMIKYYIIGHRRRAGFFVLQ